MWFQFMWILSHEYIKLIFVNFAYGIGDLQLCYGLKPVWTNPRSSGAVTFIEL